MLAPHPAGLRPEEASVTILVSGREASPAAGGVGK